MYRALTLLMIGHYFGWVCFFPLVAVALMFKPPATPTWRGAKWRETARGRSLPVANQLITAPNMPVVP